MGAGHAHALHLDRDSPVHRMAPEVKIAAMVLFTIIVVVTPRERFWAFAGYAVLLAVVAALARVRPGWLLKRSLIEVPFVILAVALPFVGEGETVTVFGLSLTVEGLYGARLRLRVEVTDAAGAKVIDERWVVAAEGPDDPLYDAGPQPDAEPAAWVEIGTGDSEFEPLAEEGDIVRQSGAQGGNHFFLHARMMGLVPEGGATRFRVYNESGARIDFSTRDRKSRTSATAIRNATGSTTSTRPKRRAAPISAN